jgi:endonuclease YncB( thermonuclease family)
MMLFIVGLFAEQPIKFDFTYNPDSVVVIDGDTIHVDVNVSGCPDVLCKELPVRLDGIDTAEIHSKNVVEKKYAVMAREEMINFLARGEFYIYKCTRDKFFRVDCSIMDANGNDYAEYILSKKLAIRYEGDKKTYDWSKHQLP